MSTDTPVPASTPDATAPLDPVAALLESYGLVDGPAPQGLHDLCALACAATGARGAEIVVTGRPTPVVAVGEPDTDLTASVALRSEAGLQFGELRLRAAEDVSATVTEQLARSIAASCDLQAAQDRIFDLEQELALAEDEVARASGQIVHDLNNPLAAVSMCLEIAREQVADGELLASLLDRATGSADKMKRMVVSLSEYGQKIVPGVTDLAVEVPALVAEFSPLLDETVVVADSLPVVGISPGDVRTVLTALWENSVKFAGEDEALEVAVGAEPAARGGWRIWVDDNGRGFDAADADAERIFTPTVRLDKRIPGLGLGLATVRRIVAAAGGHVGAEPRSGGGARVWFEVPDVVPQSHRQE